MSIESCWHHKVVAGPKQLAFCEVAGADTGCYGRSDKCPMPEFFDSIRDVPKETIVFPAPGTVEEHFMNDLPLRRKIWSNPKMHRAKQPIDPRTQGKR